jgi:hypothetical protein
MKVKRLLLTAIVGGTLFADAQGSARAQDAEVVTVVVDIFSGRPNPVIELSAAELADLIERAKPACEKVRDEPAEYPGHRLGYRGLLVGRGRRGAQPQKSLEISGKRVRVLKGGATTICQEKMGTRAASGGGDLVVADDDNTLERLLLDLALRRGAITADLQRIALRVLEGGS